MNFSENKLNAKPLSRKDYFLRVSASLRSNNFQSTSAEGATPNRAVRKGCYYDDACLMSAVGATPNI